MTVEAPNIEYISIRKVLGHGHVILEKFMGDEKDILSNARVSFNSDVEGELSDRDKGVIDFLMKNRHGSPFEAPVFRFDLKIPIFVMREHVRHRVASINEHSQRYSPAIDEYYIPSREDVRSQVGRPGSYSFETIESDSVAYSALNILETSQARSFQDYHTLIGMGVAKELARTVIPVGAFTRVKWTINLRALLNYLSLRNHKDAQREIRIVAEAIEELTTEQLPFIMELFNKHGRVSP